MSQETVWLLSEEGILDFSGEPIYDVPFQSGSVIAGDAGQDRLSVIANDHEVWTYASGTWDQQISTDMTLNCVCWTPDNRLLVGTERARLAWVADGELNFIDSFDAVPERKFWKTPWGWTSGCTLFGSLHGWNHLRKHSCRLGCPLARRWKDVGKSSGRIGNGCASGCYAPIRSGDRIRCDR